MKVDEWAEAVLAEGMAHGACYVTVDEVFVVEFDFLFGGVYVDVDACGGYVEEQEVHGMELFAEEFAVGLAHGVVEVGAAHEAIVDEEHAFGSLFSGGFGEGDPAVDGDVVYFFADGDELFVEFFVEEGYDALFEASGG